jgi:hypothetical protein
VGRVRPPGIYRRDRQIGGRAPKVTLTPLTRLSGVPQVPRCPWEKSGRWLLLPPSREPVKSLWRQLPTRLTDRVPRRSRGTGGRSASDDPVTRSAPVDKMVCNREANGTQTSRRPRSSWGRPTSPNRLATMCTSPGFKCSGLSHITPHTLCRTHTLTPHTVTQNKHSQSI